ncbi:MAG TPA: c-type cytochrome [Vicinamibacteria bacterium]|nr:c-type cytochrome [Vicinamibacteria bacterium]
MTAALVAVLLLVAADDVEEWVAPEAERARANPVAASDAALAKGRALFQKNCARCHGAKGDGEGPAGVDLRDPELQERLTDGEIFWKISTGRKDGPEVVMPSLARVVKAEEDRWKVVLFVRSLRAQ